MNKKKNIMQVEKKFHDKWANIEKPEKINVKLVNEAATAPEIRYIVKLIGDIKGKKILDIGCGLGEVSVYFAMKGADVTSIDLSDGMLRFSKKLARINNTKINTYLASAENFKLPLSKKFDIIYAGNCLHHANIKKSIQEIKKYLKPKGIFVSWDPIAYNPLINIYRKIASKVRTQDEHPLKLNDINYIRKNFKNSKAEYFWLCTLLIFIWMYFFERRNPNKERYWKSVIYESNKWKLFYYPLFILDRIIFILIPPLKFLCWNVVIYGENNRNLNKL
jgi:SAM-dependent methyltransferase